MTAFPLSIALTLTEHEPPAMGTRLRRQHVDLVQFWHVMAYP
jgi:hypothetical protein